MKLVPRAAVAGTGLEERSSSPPVPDSPGIKLRARGDGQFPARPHCGRRAGGCSASGWRRSPRPASRARDRKVLLKALEVLSEHAARESV
jgi:hypothetical protein